MANVMRARIPSGLASVAALLLAGMHWRDGRTTIAVLTAVAALLLALFTIRPPRFGARAERDRGD